MKKKSKIKYFSDFFVLFMVLAWAIVVVIMTAFAIYSTIKMYDNSLWSEVSTLVAIPLTGGGVTWLLKCGFQHVIATKDGTELPADFEEVQSDG